MTERAPAVSGSRAANGGLQVGDLVRVKSAPDQAKWVRDLAGRVGILVEIGAPAGPWGKNVVAIDGCPLSGFHHLDLERLP